MNWSAVAEFTLAAIALITAFALFRVVRSTQAVPVAQATVELVQAQLEIVKERLTEVTAENVRLRAALDHLREQITQTAPVKKLIEFVEQHAEAVDAQLDRIEGRLRDGSASR